MCWRKEGIYCSCRWNVLKVLVVGLNTLISKLKLTKNMSVLCLGKKSEHFLWCHLTKSEPRFEFSTSLSPCLLSCLSAAWVWNHAFLNGPWLPPPVCLSVPVCPCVCVGLRASVHVCVWLCAWVSLTKGFT